MKLFVFLTLIAGAFALRECPANSHYESCGTACPLTCDNYKNPPKFCVLMCNAGCHCDPGYVKSEDGSCVLPEECPSKAQEQVCGENEHYNSCGTDCPLTCDNYNNPPIFCNRMCRIGCECDKGFVRSRDGRCVKPDQCPQKAEQVCGENERYNGCGTACPLTCDNYDNPPKFCNLMCKIGCECEDGFVRNNEGRCVRPEQCPQRVEQVCGENERYTTCGTACPLTCDNHNNPPKICNLMCKIGCECQDGYVRNNDGRCVRPEQCPQRVEQVCGENERYTTCGTACPLTCDNHNNPPKFCNLMCKIGCECEEGYVRSNNGRCVRPEQCPQRVEQVCGENERYTSCGTACPLTCDNYDNPPKICNLMCKIGCECEEGYVRSNNGRCVRPEQCPQRAVEKNCNDKPESGMCMAYIPMWYYDTESQTCKKFIYGGCQGNGNRYASEEECMQQCGVESQSSSDVCDLPAESGRCFGYFPRYYFDKDAKQCKKFVFGGCGGNANNFKTADECQTTCGNRAAALDRPDCDKAPETGVCRAYIPRYYYDQVAGMCKTFIYGGCGGNRNNFATEDECYNKCGALASKSVSACDQEKVVGPCRAAFRKYFFNKESGKCELFYYGGCRGNDNNFRTQEECEALCVN